MAKKLSEIYAPKPQGEKDFVAKHPVKKNPIHFNKKAEQNTADKVKTFDRSAKRMGYDAGDDAKAYGVGGKVPSPTDQTAPPADGSTIYPSGKFAEEADDIEEASFVNKQKKKEYEEKKGRDQGAKNTTAAKRLARKEKPSHVSEEDEIELTDDDIDDLLDILGSVLDEDLQETSGRDFARGVNPNHPATTIKNPESHAHYSKDAVNKSIASSNRSGRKIGGAEAKKIHALLKGWRK